ncbi:patatin-like phospholipase family protein [Phenylobacterium sp.]|uniref:patatin-like phospholipase family protein n=1 Tax=Phenylobacterium sp. TaxID=1871053 RepID=UPI003BACAF48
MKPSWPRRLGRVGPPPGGVRAEPAGFSQVRFIGDEDEQGLARFYGDLPTRAPTAAPDCLRVLALSGGGAGGAFGAGAMLGLTQSGTRPKFDIVTGVSTGALIAPFAFLGSEWDEQLAGAYLGDQTSVILDWTTLRPGAGLYASDPLAGLVRRYIDAELLAAVAVAHSEGRRLFVATANLDTQRLSIWDMGAIASQGGPEALMLFKDVLIASASMPGLFPPKMISVATEDAVFAEMHVDGGTITPLFVVPEPLIVRRAQQWAVREVEVYALVNTTLEPVSAVTPMGVVPILIRSFELMLRSTYRNALRSVGAYCEINGFALHTASIPADFGGINMLRFDHGLLNNMFEHGAELARNGRLWTKIR